jgi:hypothetical protein
MRPIRLHLDTSDYAVMYCAVPGTPHAHVRETLKTMAQSGRIEIGLSYHVIFELLQKAEQKYRDDRLSRAKLLTALCGQNAFPYPTDLGAGHRFSTQCLWIPRIELAEFEVEHVVPRVIEATLHHSGLPRQERRALAKRNNFVGWLRNNPRRFGLLQWPFPFAREFAASGDFQRYISGEMTRSEANTKLRFYITDPVTVYKTWFEDNEMVNPILARRDQLANKLILMLDELKIMLGEHASLRTQIKELLARTGDNKLSPAAREKFTALERGAKIFGAEITSPQELTERAPGWKHLFGDESGLLAAQIFYAFHRDGRDIKRSDAIDLIHAMYLPHTDLWRGDKAFSTLLINNKVDFCERVVPTLLELPHRIETEIARRQPPAEDGTLD